jgi:hypothetical protein
MPAGKPEANNFSVVLAAQSGDPAERSKAIEHIVTAHWKPLYKYLRAQYRLSHAEATTVTLNFLSLLEARDFLSKFDGRKIPLREFLRQKLDVFLPTPGARNTVAPTPPFDFPGAEDEFLADQATPGRSGIEYYDNEWVRILLTLAVEDLCNKLATEGKDQDFALFMKLDLQDRSGDQRVSLEVIANELSMPMNEAWNSLAKTRQRFQEILLELIRSFTSSEAEFRRETQAFVRR